MWTPLALRSRIMEGTDNNNAASHNHNSQQACERLLAVLLKDVTGSVQVAWKLNYSL
jgi:hypothetical protein